MKKTLTIILLSTCLITATNPFISRLLQLGRDASSVHKASLGVKTYHSTKKDSSFSRRHPVTLTLLSNYILHKLQTAQTNSSAPVIDRAVEWFVVTNS